MLETALDVLGLSLDTVWAEINRADDGAEPAESGRRARDRLAS